VKNSLLHGTFDLKTQQWNPHLLPQVAPMVQPQIAEKHNK
jgi:hypothetical protein